MARVAEFLLAGAVFLAPFAGVGLVEVLTGRSPGTGVQPAFLPLVLLCGWLVVDFLRRPSLSGAELRVLEALLWTAAATALTWTLVDMGLAGEHPWAKAVKQLVLWTFFVVSAVAVARALGVVRIVVVERALSLGVLVACLLAIWRALAGPEFTTLGVLDTNASIAHGSDELYLGHSFTGIARLRGAMPEPLLFGNYLLASVPLVIAAGVVRAGRARRWRLVVAALGLVCLVGTWSRGVWLGALVAVAVFVVIAWRRRWLRVPGWRTFAFGLGGLALAAVALGLATGTTPSELGGLVLRRFQQSSATHDMSNMTRFWSWRAALDILREAPLQGAGWGSYGFLFFRHASGLASSAHFGWPVPNNLALLLLAETGLVGLLLWLRALRPAFASLFRSTVPAPELAPALALVGVLVHYATFSQWNLPHFWILVGAAVAVGVQGPRAGA